LFFFFETHAMKILMTTSLALSTIVCKSAIHLISKTSGILHSEYHPHVKLTKACTHDEALELKSPHLSGAVVLLKSFYLTLVIVQGSNGMMTEASLSFSF